MTAVMDDEERGEPKRREGWAQEKGKVCRGRVARR